MPENDVNEYLSLPREKKADPDSGTVVLLRPNVFVAERTKPAPDLCDPREFAPRWWQASRDDE
jgi:hypothetical protein